MGVSLNRNNQPQIREDWYGLKTALLVMTEPQTDRLQVYFIGGETFSLNVLTGETHRVIK